MGRSYTSAYRLEMDGCTSMCWWVNKEPNSPYGGNGKPNEENLLAYIKSYSRSLEIGGCNQHISKSLGHVPYPKWARIVRQRDGKVMVAWEAAMFQVY